MIKSGNEACACSNSLDWVQLESPDSPVNIPAIFHNGRGKRSGIRLGSGHLQDLSCLTSNNPSQHGSSQTSSPPFNQSRNFPNGSPPLIPPHTSSLPPYPSSNRGYSELDRDLSSPGNFSSPAIVNPDSLPTSHFTPSPYRSVRAFSHNTVGSFDSPPVTLPRYTSSPPGEILMEGVHSPGPGPGHSHGHSYSHNIVHSMSPGVITTTIPVVTTATTTTTTTNSGSGEISKGVRRGIVESIPVIEDGGEGRGGRPRTADGNEHCREQVYDDYEYSGENPLRSRLLPGGYGYGYGYDYNCECECECECECGYEYDHQCSMDGNQTHNHSHNHSHSHNHTRYHNPNHQYSHNYSYSHGNDVGVRMQGPSIPAPIPAPDPVPIPTPVPTSVGGPMVSSRNHIVDHENRYYYSDPPANPMVSNTVSLHSMSSGNGKGHQSDGMCIYLFIYLFILTHSLISRHWQSSSRTPLHLS